MTLLVAVATPDSIWTLADRQLAANGEVQSTDACKIVGFDATNGTGLLGYAGEGMFADTDPADWAASVFDGLDTDLRGYMVALAEAAEADIPAEVRSTAPGHLFVAVGVVDEKPVIYSLIANEDGELSLRRHDNAYAFMLSGSGGAVLAASKEEHAGDARELIDWIKKVESEDAHPREVTDRLARWNGSARDESDEVGTRAIVAYRFVRDGEAAAGRSFYDGAALQPPDAQLPHMSRGTDVNKMFDLMKKQAMGVTLSMKDTAQLLAYKRRTAESE